MWDNFRVGFSLASNTLRRGNRKTLALTIFVLSLIFVNLIFLPSMINGMMTLFVGAVTDYTYGNVVIEPAAQEIYISDADELVSKANALNGVKAATKRLSSGATLRYKEKFVGANVLGINPDEEKSISKFHEIVSEGDFLTKLSRDEIMVGRLLAGEEGGPEIYDDLGGVPVGSLINLTFSNGVTRQYKIKGIHEAGPEISDMVALIHYKELENVLGISGEDKASTVVIRIYNEGEEPVIKQKLIDAGVKEKVFTWQEKIEDLIRDFLKSFRMLTIMSEIVSIIVAMAIIFIKIYINNLNRKKQIGILQAIGITKKSIIFSYMFMSLFYVLAGILAGALLLLAIVLYLQQNPLVFYETMTLAPDVDFAFVFQSILTLILISLVAGFIPAWMVTRGDLIKTIWGR